MTKIVAALLAFFIGGLGVHKFYLGKNQAGVIMLLMGTVGWLLVLPGLAVCLIAFIEFIVYLRPDATQEVIDSIGKSRAIGWTNAE